MKPAAEGSVHRPASSGPMPSTSCRYCAMKRSTPPTMKMPERLAASAALNAGARKSRRSISGSSIRRWRRTKTRADREPGRDRDRRPVVAGAVASAIRLMP